MFSNTVSNGNIPINFLNSIITNQTLYEMFRDNYEDNLEYFQNREKDEYLSSILEFIEEELTLNKFLIRRNHSDFIECVKKFYDDFLLDIFKNDPVCLFKTSLFKNLHALYDQLEEVKSIYNYVFFESLDYEVLSNKIMEPILNNLEKEDRLSMGEFNTLNNYVKNNIYGYVDMKIVTLMIRNHAYKKNHIFDKETIKCLLESTMKSYLGRFDINCSLEFDSSALNIKASSGHSFNPNIISIDSILIDTFITGNYVELFNVLFYEMNNIKNGVLLMRNEENYETLKVVMAMIIEKVDMSRIYVVSSYMPQSYYADLSSSAFVQTLKFYQSLGVDLFTNYIDNRLDSLKYRFNEAGEKPKKEVSIEIKFFQRFMALDAERRKEYIDKYNCLKMLFDDTASRLKTIDMIKIMRNESYLKEYLLSSIIPPDYMLDDVIDLANYDGDFKLAKDLLKYIYVDTFYYSVCGYINLRSTKMNFDLQNYLNDLLLRVNSIKDTENIHDFIQEAMRVIEEMQQKG